MHGLPCGATEVLSAMERNCPSRDDLLRLPASTSSTARSNLLSHVASCADCATIVGQLDGGETLLEEARRAQAHSLPPTVAHSSIPQELRSLSGYANFRLVGDGGMGTVYAAENLEVGGRTEALKIVHADRLRDPAAKARFLQGDVRAAAKVLHQNVAVVFWVRELGGLVVLAMEYLPSDLHQVVRERGPLPIPEACNYVAQAALGLEAARLNGLVHRDVKPSNLLLAHQPGRRPSVKVTDFGLAKELEDRSDGLTLGGKMMGTPDYMAPEQWRSARDVDIRADVYSLGCTLFYLLTGRAPFHAESLYELGRMHDVSTPPRLDALRADVPNELADVVDRMLAKKPIDRFQTPGEVAKTLAPFTKLKVAATPQLSAAKAMYLHECPSCSAKMKVAETRRGKDVQCPKCQKFSRVPAEAPAWTDARAVTGQTLIGGEPVGPKTMDQLAERLAKPMEPDILDDEPKARARALSKRGWVAVSLGLFALATLGGGIAAYRSMYAANDNGNGEPPKSGPASSRFAPPSGRDGLAVGSIWKGIRIGRDRSGEKQHTIEADVLARDGEAFVFRTFNSDRGVFEHHCQFISPTQFKITNTYRIRPAEFRVGTSNLPDPSSIAGDGSIGGERMLFSIVWPETVNGPWSARYDLSRYEQGASTPTWMPPLNSRWTAKQTGAEGKVFHVTGQVTSAEDRSFVFIDKGDEGVSWEWTFDVVGEALRMKDVRILKRKGGVPAEGTPAANVSNVLCSGRISEKNIRFSFRWTGGAKPFSSEMDFRMDE